MIRLKVTFSIDATGLAPDITKNVMIPSDVCLYCLHDKENRLYDEVQKAVEAIGFDLRYYFKIMKIYIV
jgi:hypothetical protein